MRAPPKGSARDDAREALMRAASRDGRKRWVKRGGILAPSIAQSANQRRAFG